jgi:hypothetical protein
VSFNAKPGVGDTLVVDCLHPTCPTLTHHKGGRTPKAVSDDTSGGTVLNALTRAPELLAGLTQVTCNHYDIDGLVSVWAAMMRPEEALRHAPVSFPYN